MLFPRLPGPIWSLPKDAYSGMTGLDDSMSPGNISALSQSDAVAFRVSFEGTVPLEPYNRKWLFVLDLAARVAQITRLYSQLRYDPSTTPQQLLRLKKVVNEFKP